MPAIRPLPLVIAPQVQTSGSQPSRGAVSASPAVAVFAPSGRPIRGQPIVVSGQTVSVVSGIAAQVQPNIAALPAIPASPGQAFGIDISAYEGKVNPATISRVPSFVILKASEGTYSGGEAGVFSNNYAAYQSAGVPLIGAYHYLRTDYPVGPQVKTFLQATQGKNISFYAVDVEAQQGKYFLKSPGQFSAYAQQARDFISQVQSQTSKPVFLYTSSSIYNQAFKQPSDKSLPLWLAWPTNNASIQSPAATIGGKEPQLWQKNWGIPAQQFGIRPPTQGGAVGVDFETFAGSTAQMQAYINSLR